MKLWIDFETGGVEPHHSPLSFAMIATQGDEIIGQWYTQIRQHPLVVDTKALEINKIDISQPGLTFEQFKKEYFIRINKWFYGGSNFHGNWVAPKINPSKANMPLMCAWNINFDRPILRRILNSTYDGAYYHCIDPMILAHTLVDIGIMPRTENFRLETVAKFLGVEPEGELHNALTDIKVTFEVYKKLQELISNKVIATLVKEVSNESILESHP